MTIRFAGLFVFVTLVFFAPAAASQPEGLAGEIISSAPSLQPGSFCGFEWLLGDYEMPLGPTDTVTLDLAIVPFDSGVTNVGVDFGPYYMTALSLIFADGLVNGIPYNRSAWNDVTARFDVARREYDLTVNGRQGGPFSASSECSGGCTTLSSFRVNGGSNAAGAVAWIDSISVVRHSAAGDESYVWFTAEPCSDRPSVSGGGIVFLEPPKKLRPPR
jgi:hypothetical protein